MNNAIVYELNMQLNMLKNNNKYSQLNDLQQDIEKYKE
jgi:hypothetical protein